MEEFRMEVKAYAGDNIEIHRIADTEKNGTGELS